MQVTLALARDNAIKVEAIAAVRDPRRRHTADHRQDLRSAQPTALQRRASRPGRQRIADPQACNLHRSEEHTSELQSLMRISYAVFCLKKKKQNTAHSKHTISNHIYT